MLHDIAKGLLTISAALKVFAHTIAAILLIIAWYYLLR